MTKIKKDLTVYSEAPQEIPGPKPKVVCYTHDKNYITVPYHYGETVFGKPKKKFKQDIETFDLELSGQLRPYQKRIIDQTLEHFETKTRGGILALGTGLGKTFIAICLISMLKVKTLIVVHKQILLDQWIERIQQFLPNARIGIIQGSKIDIQDKDIVIGMVQTMTQRDYDRDQFKSFGMIVCDETHAMCSQTFNQIFFKVQAKYRLGLSATPKRKDGFDQVLNFHLGPIICEMHFTIVEPSITVYHLDQNDDIEMSLTRFGKTNLPALVTDIAGNDQRNAFITKILLDRVKDNRKVLVLSDRVYQCERLYDFFKKNCKTEHTSDTFIGKKSRDKLDKAMECDVIFATYGIFKEGVDCPKLDTLIFATPKTDITQAIGRILRQKNDNHPEVIDIVDHIGPLKNQFYKRNRYYKGKNYSVVYYDQDGNELSRTQPNEAEEDNHNFKGRLVIRDD